MSSSKAASDGRVRKRAVAACTFCRKRKIRCDARRPVCNNCSTYEKACIYDRDLAKSRPFSTGSVDQNPNVPIDDPARATTPTLGQPVLSNASPNKSSAHNLSRIVVSANGIPSYHGQTSALFEENQHARSHPPTPPRMPDEWVEKGLVAEAARQRQLEEFNFRQRGLDFDGVDPELGMHLLSLHWNRQHHSFLITYRPAFMRDMASGGPYFSKLLLNAIYFGASKFSPRQEVRKDPNDVRTAGWKFRERVRELLVSALDRSDVTTIQALLVMTNSLFALGDERGAAWLYAGLAFRMIIDLGIHVDAADVNSTRSFSDEDLEVRRRIFWGAFVVDKIQSLYQGRPVTLKESDTLVPLKFLDTYEELEHWMPFAYTTHSNEYDGSPAYSISTFTSLCTLSVILSEILSCIYTERSFDKSPSELAQMLEELGSKLANWYDGLPPHLIFDHQRKPKTSPPPHVLSLHAMYNVLLILVHRPFISEGHLHNNFRSISVNSIMVCASAASRIVSVLETYHQAFSVRRAPYLISYATYVAAIIHARVAAQKGSESEAQRCLEMCLAVFKENQETNSAVRRANRIVRGLMKRLSVSSPDAVNDAFGDEAPGHCRPSLITQTDRSEHSNPVETEQRSHANSSASHLAQSNLDSIDIDGIIQMFNQEQGLMYANPGVVPPSSAQYGGTRGSNPSLQQAFRPYPSDYQSNRQLNFGSTMTFLPNGDANFQLGNAANGVGSLDDLLFGFNGSALDAFGE